MTKPTPNWVVHGSAAGVYGFTRTQEQLLRCNAMPSSALRCITTLLLLLRRLFLPR